MKKKSYKLTFGLKEGYDKNSRVHPLKSAGQIIQDWMVKRLVAGEPVIIGLLQEGLLLFPAVNAQEQVTASPSGIFSGELSTPEDLRRTNKEIKTTLESLADALKQGLKQESVYIIYRDRNWCV
jgi:hypothetical protein